MKNTVRAFAAIFTVWFMLVTPANAAAKLRLGVIDLSIYAVAGEIVKKVLEELGHGVEVQIGSHEVIYPRLGSGELDLLVAVWLPNAHAAYWEKYKSDTVQIAVLYDNARLYWAVPAYVPTSDVASIADLANPVNAARFDKRVLNVGAGSGLTAASRQAVQRYGLAAVGFETVVVDAATRTADVNRLVAERRAFVLPLSNVQWLNKAFELRELADPLHLFGGTDRGILVGRTSSFQNLPARTQAVLGRIRLGVKAVVEMDYLVNIEKKTAQQAAHDWMAAHRELVADWFR